MKFYLKFIFSILFQSRLIKKERGGGGGREGGPIGFSQFEFKLELCMNGLWHHYYFQHTIIIVKG
jgi:hypothetical protein